MSDRIAFGLFRKWSETFGYELADSFRSAIYETRNKHKDDSKENNHTLNNDLEG